MTTSVTDSRNTLQASSTWNSELISECGLLWRHQEHVWQQADYIIVNINKRYTPHTTVPCCFCISKVFRLFGSFPVVFPMYSNANIQILVHVIFPNPTEIVLPCNQMEICTQWSCYINPLANMCLLWAAGLCVWSWPKGMAQKLDQPHTEEEWRLRYSWMNIESGIRNPGHLSLPYH